MIHYILQIIGFQLVFLLVYEVFLKKETFFTWNRVYLLLTPLVSLVLPFLKIPALQQSIPESYKIALPEVLTGVPLQERVLNGGQLAEVTITGTGSVNLYTILTNIWYVGVLMGVLFFAYKLYKIWNLSSSGTSRKIDGIRVITLPNSTTAFSFFNTMYLGADLSETQRKSIVMHEAVHIKERHTLDLLFFEILRIVFWFNPLVYIYQKELTLLQEFQADATAVLQTDKAKYYQELLARVFQTEKISFINTFFNHSFIKKRITMLQKSKSNRVAKFKYALIVPLLCAMLFYVSCSVSSVEPVNSTKTSDASSENDVPNMVVTLSEIGEKGLLTVGVKDKSLLTEDEINFIKAAKMGIGLRDMAENRSSSFFEFDEFFLVYSSLFIENLAKEKGVSIKFFSSNSNSDIVLDIEQVPNSELENIPFAVIDKVPTYNDCSGSNDELKKCMSDAISKFVNENFNVGLAKELGLKGVNRVFVSFRINKNGNITNIRARAPHPELEDEAIRVLRLIPDMEKPGEHNGRPVGVLYSLPITFKIQE